MNPKAFLAAQGYSSRSNQRAEAQRPTNPRIGYISLGRSPAAEQGGSFVKSLSSLFLPLFFTLFLTACSGYKEFYKQAQGVTPEAVAVMRVAPPPPTPIVEHAQPGDSMTILDAYAKRGYIMTGNSMFKSGHPESEDSAVRQAQDVGADLVLILDRRYTGSVTSNIPITTLTNTNNSDYYRDSDTITTYVPHTIPMFDYGAVYFVKQRFENSVRSAVISTTQNAKNFKSTRAHWSDWSLMGARPSMPIC